MPYTSPIPNAAQPQKALTMKITHLLSSAFASLFRTVKGYQPFSGDCKVVETSRYTHATDCYGSRVYMSKPSWSEGLTLSTSAVRTGDEYISLTLSEGRRVLATVSCKVTDAKAVAATLASACMKAQPRTGRTMGPSNWQAMPDTVAARKAEVQYEASLFNGV
jgi:hypothetical protein